VLGPLAGIADYNAAVLDRYVGADGEFDVSRYYHEVYRWNVDVWGLLMAYLPLVENSKNPWRTESLPNAVSRILCKYCLSPEYAAKPIPVAQLADELISLNRIVGHPADLPRQREPKRVAVPTGRATRKLVVVKQEDGAFPWKGKRCPKGSRRCKHTSAPEGSIACCPKN
jgi:hypothetical protein